MSCTTTAPGGADASSSAARARTSGCTIASSAARRSGSANTSAPRRARSSPPPGASTSGPKSATTAASPGVPGATTSRARASASTTTAPRSRRSAETVLFPEATPPVIPTRTLRTLRRGLAELAHKCLSYRAPSINRHYSQTKGSFSESDQEHNADGRRNRHHRSRGQPAGSSEPGRHKRPCARDPLLEHHRPRVRASHAPAHRRSSAQRQGGRQGHPQRPDRPEQGRHPLPSSPRARGARQLRPPDRDPAQPRADQRLPQRQVVRPRAPWRSTSCARTCRSSA